MKKIISLIACISLCCCLLCLNGCASNKNYDSEITELERQINALKTNHNDELNDLQQQIDKLEAQKKADQDKMTEYQQQIDALQQKTQNLQINLLNSDYGFFTRSAKNEFTYSDFDYSMKNTDYSYETGTEENELLFEKILSGELYYEDYLDWFALHLEYVIRFNEEALKCIEAVLREGEFTEELRVKYFGLYISDATYPLLPTAGMSKISYSINFNDDWTIWYFDTHNGTVRNSYKPVYDENGKIKYYYLSFSDAGFIADMGDGTADCSVCVTYYQTKQTSNVWNGEKQIHENVEYITECRITADCNNIYSGGKGDMFDPIFIFTEEAGFFDLEKLWEAFKKQALTPSLNLYPDLSEAKIRFLKFDI